MSFLSQPTSREELLGTKHIYGGRSVLQFHLAVNCRNGKNFELRCAFLKNDVIQLQAVISWWQELQVFGVPEDNIVVAPNEHKTGHYMQVILEEFAAAE